MSAPVKIDVQVKGLREIEANLKVLRESFGVKTGGVLIRGLKAGMQLVRDEAKRLAPKGTGLRFVKRRKSKEGRATEQRTLHGGLLRANIVYHAIPTGSRVANGRPTVIVRVRSRGYTRRNGKMVFNRPGSSPGYWWLVEFGTSDTAPHPFVRPAFESQKGRALVEFRRHVMQEIIDLSAKFRKAA